MSAKDVEFVQEAQKFGCSKQLTCQPLKPPDLIVLDFGFFYLHAEFAAKQRLQKYFRAGEHRR